MIIGKRDVGLSQSEHNQDMEGEEKRKRKRRDEKRKKMCCVQAPPALGIIIPGYCRHVLILTKDREKM